MCRGPRWPSPGRACCSLGLTLGLCVGGLPCEAFPCAFSTPCARSCDSMGHSAVQGLWILIRFPTDQKAVLSDTASLTSSTVLGPAVSSRLRKEWISTFFKLTFCCTAHGLREQHPFLAQRDTVGVYKLSALTPTPGGTPGHLGSLEQG